MGGDFGRLLDQHHAIARYGRQSGLRSPASNLRNLGPPYAEKYAVTSNSLAARVLRRNVC